MTLLELKNILEREDAFDLKLSALTKYKENYFKIATKHNFYK
jgi:hypothetical protein